MADTATQHMIDCLRDVADLDHLQSLVSNPQTDQYAPPQYAAWLIDLVNTERRRRGTDDEITDYPMRAFSRWPARQLYSVVTITLAIAEAAIIEGEPTILAFVLRLQELVVASAALALIERESEAARLAEELRRR